MKKNVVAPIHAKDFSFSEKRGWLGIQILVCLLLATVIWLCAVNLTSPDETIHTEQTVGQTA